ncbi:hypothetical protein [Antrihabitans stalactiti]|uniref:Uncharacterized protein n=1 Tax=Antrihabitans stalactiti TaxID=2584121 RepID=A0A848K9N2_9NOCA|nr:hypothetical protein [Antrihabitans stalactiti]NMN93984.1 hypothetical protein [Antrihabitans stalactiti]
MVATKHDPTKPIPSVQLSVQRLYRTWRALLQRIDDILVSTFDRSRLPWRAYQQVLIAFDVVAGRVLGDTDAGLRATVVRRLVAAEHRCETETTSAETEFARALARRRAAEVAAWTRRRQLFHTTQIAARPSQIPTRRDAPRFPVGSVTRAFKGR